MVGNSLSSLKLVHMRSHVHGDFTFDENVNAIVGLNGSGKTTLLEAMYVLLRGNSFRGTTAEMIQRGEHSMALELTVTNSRDSNTIRRLHVNLPENNTPIKKWIVNNNTSARLPPRDKLPVVLFEPDIGRMITGSPERRRHYVDNLASQLDPHVAQAQLRFERTLRQRNLLLKSLDPHHITKAQNDQLFVWNMQLATLSETLVTGRQEVLVALQKDISSQYRMLGGDDSVHLTYQSSVTNQANLYGNRLLQFFGTSLMRDAIVGHTSFGPHRDDIEIRLADQHAKERASRGEIRTIVLALKLLEAELLHKKYTESNVRPVLLFDDVLSELDLHHQAQILSGFKDYQVFITTTDAHTLTPGTYTIAL